MSKAEMEEKKKQMEDNLYKTIWEIHTYNQLKAVLEIIDPPTPCMEGCKL